MSRATAEQIAWAIINLAQGGTDRIRELGGECDDADRTYGPDPEKFRAADSSSAHRTTSNSIAPYDSCNVPERICKPDYHELSYPRYAGFGVVARRSAG